MADNFGLKIGVEGEKEFKKALADINQSFKVLGSEMKLVESEFDKQDKSVAALTARNEVLGKQIDEQKDRISTLEQALANAATSFGENDRRTQAWAVQLNNAKADLNNLQRELSSNEKSLETLGGEMDEAERNTKGFGDELRKSADTADDAGGRFSGLGGIVAGLGAAMAAAFAAVAAAAVAAGKALVDMSTSGAAFADEVLTTSTQTGIATDKLQEYMYAAELVDVSVDTLTGSMAKQIKSMKSAQDGSSSYTEAYKKLGVAVTNADGSLRDSDAVYWDVIDALGEMKNETERDALAMTLLGKSAQDLNPLIEVGADRMTELGEQAQAAGYVMSDQLLAAYGALDDQLQYLSVGATAAKNALGTVLLPVLTDLAGEGTALIGEFTNGVLAANGDIEKIAQVVGDVLPKALNKIMEYVPAVLSLVMEIVSSLGTVIVDNLPMLVETAGQIVFTLLEGMIAALPQITEGALQLILALVEGLIENLPQIIETAIQMVFTLATGIAEALPELIPTLVQAIVYICQVLVSNIDLIIQAALALVTGLAQGVLAAIPVLIAALPEIITRLIDKLLSSLPQIIETGVTLLTALIEALPDSIKAIVAAIPQIIDGIISALTESLPLINQAGIDLFVALIGALPDIIVAIIAAIPQIITSIIDALINSIPLLIEAGIQLFIALIENLPYIITEIVKAVPQIVTAIVSAFGGLMYKIVDVGKSIVTGIWQGIQNMASWFTSQVKSFFSSIVDGVKSTLGINSPSKVFSQIGGFMAEGLGEGFSSEMGRVSKEIQDSIPTDVDTTVNANLSGNIVNGLIGGLSSLLGNGSQAIVLQVNLDGKTIAQTVFDPLLNVSKQRGVALG